MEANERVAFPFKNLEDLYKGLDTLPYWPEIDSLRPSTNYVYRGSELSKKIERPERLQRNDVPKTIICHDLMGGYLEDKFIDGSNEHNSYHFYHWSIVDTFIYFSHHFVTIPPFGWISAAHKHGVKILGTIITENENGYAIIKEILKNRESILRFADALILLAQFYKFEGWLLNIENEVDKTDISKLQFFIKYLTENIHKKIDNSEIIWYDSVNNDGKLLWQNELNDKNESFFDCCDGIFLNYNWTDSGLSKSVDIAKQRNRIKDVYVGLDVWGRGCPGGGGFNSAYAMQKIRKQGLSAAIFAPAWTFEYFGPETFPKIENIFWAQLMDYLYIHVPVYENQRFITTFCRGAGMKYYEYGAQITYQDPETHAIVDKNSSFYNMAMQKHQVTAACTHLKFVFKKVLPPTVTDGKSKPEPQESIYDTAHERVKVLGNSVTIEDKIVSFLGINCEQYSYDISYEGGGCLKLLNDNSESYHRLFLVNVGFSKEIRARIIYRLEDTNLSTLKNENNVVLVLGNSAGTLSFSPQETIQFGLGWKMSIFRTNLRATHEIGVSLQKKGICYIGKIVLEEDRSPRPRRR